MKKRTRGICISALIAALYVVLTYVSSLFGLSSGVIQLRLSEALCIMPAFSVYGVWGVSLGCLISNILFSGIPLDIIFGTLATLVGCIGTYYLARVNKYLSLTSPIVSNTVIIPFVLAYGFGAEQSHVFLAISIFIGEALSCGVFGSVLCRALSKSERIFR